MVYEMRYNNKVICDGENYNDVLNRGEKYFREDSEEPGWNYVTVEMHSDDKVERIELEFFIDKPWSYDSPIRL